MQLAGGNFLLLFGPEKLAGIAAIFKRFRNDDSGFTLPEISAFSDLDTRSSKVSSEKFEISDNVKNRGDEDEDLLVVIETECRDKHFIAAFFASNMFTCISCAKTDDEDGAREESGSTTPSSKDAVKNITSQIKDMALKFSGSSKPYSGSSTFKKSYPDFDTVSDGIPYPFPGGGPSSSSTPAWDFPTRNPTNRFMGDRPSTVSLAPSDVVLEDDDEPKEWMAQVEPGVHITFVSLPHGGNDLKRIRFSRDIFDKWQAQKWWAENYDRIMELYNVQRFNRQALNAPSEDGRDSSYSRVGSVMESPMVRDWTPRNHYRPPLPGNRVGGFEDHGGAAASSSYGPPGGEMDASRMTTSSRDEASVSYSNASEVENEWVEEDEPGVYITIRQLVDGSRELRRVRFSRERFGEVRAKTWWEENRDRIQSQYL